MKVLIICEKFAPENTVGAIRMSKLAKYLKLDYGWKISVLARCRKNYTELGDAQYVDHFYYTEEGCIVRKMIEKYKEYSSSAQYDANKRASCSEQKKEALESNAYKTSAKEYIKSIFTVAYSEITPQSYARKAMRVLSNEINSFDVVISSFGPASSHYIARKLKKKKSDIIWISDFRDPLAIGESTKGFLNKWGKTFAKRVCAQANFYTVASKGFIYCLGLENKLNVNVITNGYDVDDFKNQVAGKKSAHTKMHFVYTGTLFPGSRDISAIFQAVKELVTEGKMDVQKICFSYAGQHKNEFLRQYNNSGLDAEMKAYDVIPKSEAVAMQQSADLLMISAWNTKEYQGSLPLKVYEYLYTGQPILCCICGTAVNSELKQIILNCSAGTCYEEAGGQENFDVFKGKILEYYKELFEKGYLESQNKNGQSDTIKRFNYKNITKQFADLIIIEYERANHGK